MAGIDPEYVQDLLSNNLGMRVVIRYCHETGYGLESYSEATFETGVIHSVDTDDEIVVLRTRSGMTHFSYGSATMYSIELAGVGEDADVPA